MKKVNMGTAQIQKVMIKTQNSIKQILEKHHEEQVMMADVIRLEKIRQNKILMEKLLAKKQAKLQDEQKQSDGQEADQ
eukprot:403334125